MTDTRILTALYADHATAERAAERLRAIGVPEHHIEMHRSEEGDVVPGQHVTSGGLFGALSGLLVPESDLRTYERGLAGGCTVVVASHVPSDRVRAARQALDEDALEVDTEREATPAEADDGFGRATGAAEHLTGEPIGEDRPQRSRLYDPR